MVSSHHDHRDPRVVEPAQLADPEQSSVEIPPVAVKDIPGHDHQVDFLLDGGIDEILYGPPSGAPNLRNRRALVGGQPAEGAVDMKIGGVEELHDDAPARGINLALSTAMRTWARLRPEPRNEAASAGPTMVDHRAAVRASKPASSQSLRPFGLIPTRYQAKVRVRSYSPVS